MLEAQISINPDSKDGVSKQGDAIVVALAGHPWGTLDKKHLRVVEWDDAELEAYLIGRQKAGEAWPVTVFPYAVHDTDGTMLKRSAERVDLASITAISKAVATDKAAALPTIPWANYQMIKDSLARRVVNAITGAWNWLVG